MLVLRLFFILFYSFIIISGFLGNICVVVAIAKHKRLRTPVHIFLVNVSLSDLLFIVLSSGNAAEFLLHEWTFGDVICRLQGSLVEASYTISVWSLAAVSIERCMSICNPHKKERTVRKCVKWASLIWFIALLICSPLMYGYTVLPNEYNALDCSNNRWTEEVRLIYYSVHTVFVYILPLILMIITHYKICRYLCCRGNIHANGYNLATTTDQDTTNTVHTEAVSNRYTTERKLLEKLKAMKKRSQNLKVVKLLIVIIALFFALWSPYMVMRMVKYYGCHVTEMLWKGAHLLLLATSAVNFFIYAFMSKKLRKVFKSFFMCSRSDDNCNDSRLSSNYGSSAAPSVVKSGNFDETLLNAML